MIGFVGDWSPNGCRLLSLRRFRFINKNAGSACFLESVYSFIEAIGLQLLFEQSTALERACLST